MWRGTSDREQKSGKSCVAAAAPASIEAQIADKNSPITQLVTRYYDCVRKSAATQIQLVPDRALAAEQAFAACQTEERAIHAWLVASSVEPSIAQAS